ncbi:hypothetical protein AAG906_012379 [Vitis piasezkii]
MVAVRYTTGVKMAIRVREGEMERRGVERERERGRDVRERIKKIERGRGVSPVCARVVRWRRLVEVGSPDDYDYGANRGLLVDLLIMGGGNSGRKGDDGAIAIAILGLCLFRKSVKIIIGESDGDVSSQIAVAAVALSCLKIGVDS